MTNLYKESFERQKNKTKISPKKIKKINDIEALRLINAITRSIKRYFLNDIPKYDFPNVANNVLLVRKDIDYSSDYVQGVVNHFNDVSYEHFLKYENPYLYQPKLIKSCNNFADTINNGVKKICKLPLLILRKTRRMFLGNYLKTEMNVLSSNINKLETILEIYKEEISDLNEEINNIYEFVGNPKIMEGDKNGK